MPVSIKLVWRKLLDLLSIKSIKKPTNEFTHVIPDIRFENEKVLHKSDK